MSERKVYFPVKCQNHSEEYPKTTKVVVNCGSGIGLALFSKCCFSPIKSLVSGRGIKLEDLGEEIRISKNKKIRGKVVTTNNCAKVILAIPIKNQTSMMLNVKIICSQESNGSTNAFVINKVFQKRDGVIHEKEIPDRLEFKDNKDVEVLFSHEKDKVFVLVQGLKQKIFHWNAKANILKTTF